MKKLVITISAICFIILALYFIYPITFNHEEKRPDDFVDVKQAIPQMQFDIRYYSDHNFVGRRVKGYLAPVCILTKPAVEALKKVENQLLPMGLTLKAYDCYRPKTAVADFVHWASQINNTKMRDEFYPIVDKRNLFKEGYISDHSSHSRGSTIDLTIVLLNSQIPQYSSKQRLVSCTAPQQKRFADNSLDFGSGFDCFSPVSHPDYPSLTPQIKANRLLLKNLMENAGFQGVETEWWHFTLVHEPYPNTSFDFPVK